MQTAEHMEMKNGDDMEKTKKSTQSPDKKAADGKFNFEYSVDGYKLLFRMPDEQANIISASSSRVYEKKADALITSARKVRQQQLFGNVVIFGMLL